MARITVSTDISAPVDKVFAAFTDLDHDAGRVKAIKKIEITSTGPFNLGTKWIESREAMGRMHEAEMEVTAFERNKTYTLTHYQSGVRMDAIFTFDQIPTGTKVGIEFELSNQGLPPGLLLPIEWAIAGRVRHALSDDLSDLKHAIEQIAQT
jgi:uncharacterized protein YndB with AHSA1/START domain